MPAGSLQTTIIMRITLNNVNKAIGEKWPGVKLFKERDYFYVYSDDDKLGLQIAGLYKTSIEVNKITNASIEDWIRMVGFVLDDMYRPYYDRQPVKVDLNQVV